MPIVFPILVSARVRRLGLALGMVAMLAACGQRGPLFLPKGEAAAGRATLPEILNPTTAPANPASGANTPTGAATPAPRP